MASSSDRSTSAFARVALLAFVLGMVDHEGNGRPQSQGNCRCETEIALRARVAWLKSSRTVAESRAGIDVVLFARDKRPPIIVGDVIVVGAAFLRGATPPTKEMPPGHIRGYDVRTGELRWWLAFGVVAGLQRARDGRATT